VRIFAPYILVVMGERNGYKGVQQRKIHRHEWKDLIANIFLPNLCGV